MYLMIQSILRRVDIRQLSGICRYPAKCAAIVAVNQGGTAGKVYLFVLDRVYYSVRGVFLYPKSSDGKSKLFLEVLV